MTTTNYRPSKKPCRCSLCGQPNPETDDGYTECCNEPVLWPGDENGRGYSYRDAERAWKEQG